MQKFTFNKKQDLLIPETNMFTPLKNSKGETLSGDETIKRFAKIIDKFERTYNRPVPIAQQNFIAWVKQAKRMLDEGKTSEEIFAQTLVQNL